VRGTNRLGKEQAAPKEGPGILPKLRRSLLRGKLFEAFAGEQRVEVIINNVNRGAGKAAEKIDEPVLTLMRKMSKHFDVVRLVRFAYKK
jgi:hypothetical protein